MGALGRGGFGVVVASGGGGADGARGGGAGCAGRSTVAGAIGVAAVNGGIESSTGPTERLLSAAGEIATRAPANCLHALGSGSTDANSVRSASRIACSTIK